VTAQAGLEVLKLRAWHRRTLFLGRRRICVAEWTRGIVREIEGMARVEGHMSAGDSLGGTRLPATVDRQSSQ
jgi:hypothetical protein